MTTINTLEAPISPQLTDRALAIFAFAIYHQLESGTRVTSVVADDHAGHRADPLGVNELIRHELARREPDHIAFTERGTAVLQKVLATMRASASSLPLDAASATNDRERS